MNRIAARYRPCGLIVALLLLLTNSQLWCAEPEPKEPLQVFLVRHADKADNSTDAALSTEGKRRVTELVRVLGDAQLKHVHSTDYIRTRSTALEVAESHGVKVQTYNRRDSENLVKRLRQAGGRHLVVSHRSALPNIINSLGGTLGKRIVATEFDRLYFVTVDSNGTATTVLMRYGKQNKAR